MALKLTSTSFQNQSDIPAKFTCQGENINPPLNIKGVPPDTVSLALIVDDPDAATDPDGPGITFDHWIVFNIPPDLSDITENSVPPSAIVGGNTAGNPKYTGPCPPNGKHRYFFKLYALDTKLDLPEDTTKQNLEAAMKNHVIEQAQLVGLYKKS